MAKVLLADIVKLPEFQAANKAQQVWIQTYQTSGETTGTYDALMATKVAYPSCSAQNLATRACHAQSHKRIKQILAIAFGRPEFESVLPELHRAIKRSIKADKESGGGLSIATTRAITFYENALRRSQGQHGDEGRPKFEIGERFEQDGKTFQVTAMEVSNV